MMLPSMMSECCVLEKRALEISPVQRGVYRSGRSVYRDMMIPFLECFYEAISIKQNELYFLHVVIHAIGTMMCIALLHLTDPFKQPSPSSSLLNPPA